MNTQQIATAKGNIENLVTVEVVITLIDPDSGETLSRYIFTGEDGAADGGPYKVAKAAWIMDGRIVVEKGFIENMGH